jgi:hypothetical protein
MQYETSPVISSSTDVSPYDYNAMTNYNINNVNYNNGDQLMSEEDR